MGSVYIIAQKTQFIDCLRAYKALAENESRGKQSLFVVCLDKAGEQTTNHVWQFVIDNVMKLEYSPPHASH